MKRAELYALKDMLQAIDEVAEIVDGRDLAAYEREFRIHRVVERCVEIVSEACRRVSPRSKAGFPDVPWRAIEAIGNKLRHETDAWTPRHVEDRDEVAPRSEAGGRGADRDGGG